MELTQKGEIVSRLQIKASQIGRILQSLEHKQQQADEAAAASSSSSSSTATGRKPSLDVIFQQQQPPVKKPHYISSIPPFNANRIRKSPSSLMDTSTCEMALQEEDVDRTTAVVVATTPMANADGDAPVASASMTTGSAVAATLEE